MNGFVYVPSAQNSSGILSIFNRQNSRGGFTFSNGDTISATLTSRADGNATLHTPDDFTFTVPGDSISGNVGDVLHFKVIRQDSSGLALKQIHAQKLEASIARGNAGIDDVNFVSTSLEKMNEEAEYRAAAHKDQQVKAAQIVSQIRRGQRDISNNATKSAIAAIAASGLDLNKVSFFTLNNVINEIESLPETQGGRSGSRQSNRRSENNITTAVNKVQSLLSGGIADTAIAQLLKGGMDITPEQVYASRYMGGQEEPSYLDNWDTLDRQISRRFDRHGIENNQRNMDAARFLVANNIPINQHNIEATVLLRNLEHIPAEMLQSQIELTVSQGEDPSQMKLMPLLSSIDMEAVLEAIKQLPDLQPQDVRTVMEAGQPLNLKHLYEAANDRADEVYKPIETPVSSIPVPEDHILTAQRQLVEIQWKMTVQAAVRLAHKGIKIDTTHLQELVMHLRSLERDSHGQYLRAAGTEDSAQNTARMEDIFSTIRQIRPVAFHLNANISGKILSRQIDFNLTAVHQAALAYEAGSTMPDGRYGDSLQKISNQFGPLLTRLGIEPTAENIRAATILSRNEIDVSMPDIEAIKAIDAKIAAVMDKLSPMMAAQMLKEGLRPLEMHVDEMLAYVRKFEDSHGYSNRDKIAQYILEMDRSKALTPQEREGMIAVYRMLNLIQKNGAAALGMAYKQDAPLTLGGLMEAARNYDGKHIDTSIGDGYIENIVKPLVNIRTSLASATAAFGAPRPLSYTHMLADAVIDKAAPPILQEWMPNEKEALEDLLQKDPVPPSFKPNQDLAMQAVQQLTEAPPTLIAMLQNAGVMPSSKNIKAARDIKENKMISSLQKAIREIKASTKNLAEPFDFDNSSLADILESGGQKEVIQKLWDTLADAAPTEAVQDAMAMLASQYAMANDEAFEAPIPINGRLANLKLYTLNEDAVADGTARTFLSLATEGLGNVQSFFTINGNQVNLQFAAENPAARARLEANKDSLFALLQEAGFDLGELTFTYNVREESSSALAPQGREVAVNPEEDHFGIPLNTSDYEFKV